MEFIFPVIGLVVGATIAWLVATRQSAAIDVRSAVVAEQLVAAQQEQQRVQAQLAAKQGQVIELTGLLRAAETQRDGLKQQMTESESKLAVQFEALALRIVQGTAVDLKKSHREELDALLGPLKSQIGEFRQRVDSIHTDETKSLAAMNAQVVSLTQLNNQVAEQANNLASALKGGSKVQGDWGELILERLLEMSGLQEGREFELQTSIETNDGHRLRPDVIIQLPQEPGKKDKQLIIDAKVSLTAYTQYANALDEASREKYLKEHLQSVRGHVRQLSEKNYSSHVNSPEFVFLFMPIESAFLLAMRHADDLYLDALNRKVVIVTPSTLLATLHTVAALWNRARQDKNALEIADEAGLLYDKFVGFYGDVVLIKSRIDQAGVSVDAALGKLRDGNGNLVSKVEKMRKLGAKNLRSLPADAFPESKGDNEQQ